MNLIKRLFKKPTRKRSKIGQIEFGVEVKRCDKCDKEKIHIATWLPDNGIRPSWKCSFCHCQATRDWNQRALPTPFCPWCGAKMATIAREASPDV